MQCPNCKATLDGDTIFCGNCGNQVAPLHAQGATISEDQTMLIPPGSSRQNPGVSSYNAQAATRQPVQAPQVYAKVPAPVTAYGPHAPDTPGSSDPISAPAQFPTPSKKPRTDNMRVIILAGVLVLVLLIAVFAGFATLLQHQANTLGAGGATGFVSFSDSQSGQLTDTLNISITGLDAPNSGFQYQGWMIDEANEKITSLGTLTSAGKQAFKLAFTSQGKNIFSLGNVIEITKEQGNVSVPTGAILMTGKFPTLAYVHIKHLLFSFPTTPGQIGLLVGLRSETQNLNAAALTLKTVTANPDAIHCAAQSILDIDEGQHGQHAHPPSALCQSLNITQQGDGLGLLGDNGYIHLSAQHASFAATTTDTTQNIKTHAQHVINATTDLQGDANLHVQGWVTTIDQDALFVRDHPTDPNTPAKIQEIVQLATQALNGFAANQEAPQPVVGQAGALTAYIHGQLMAMLTLSRAA